MKKLRLGDSLDKCNDMGPISNEMQFKKITEMVNAAREEGCDVFQAWDTTGNVEMGDVNSPTNNSLFYPPTLITQVQTTSLCYQEEIFGPVACLISFRTAKEAIALANSCK
jgi:aldehyde dehydrogenase (NAD+)